MGRRSLELAAFLGLIGLLFAAVLLTIAWQNAFPRFLAPGCCFLFIGLLLLGHTGLQCWPRHDDEAKGRLRAQLALVLVFVFLFLWLLQSLFIITAAAISFSPTTLGMGMMFFGVGAVGLEWLIKKLNGI